MLLGFVGTRTLSICEVCNFFNQHPPKTPQTDRKALDGGRALDGVAFMVFTAFWDATARRPLSGPLHDLYHLLGPCVTWASDRFPDHGPVAMQPYAS